MPSRSWPRVGSARQPGLSMDRPAAYLLGVRPIERSRTTKPIRCVDSRKLAKGARPRAGEDGYERRRTAYRFRVALGRARGAAGYRRRVVVGFVPSRDYVRGVESSFVARAFASVGGWWTHLAARCRERRAEADCATCMRPGRVHHRVRDVGRT